LEELEELMPDQTADFVGLSADVVSAFVSNNAVQRSDLPALIASVHSAFVDAATGKKEPVAEPLVPPVPIKKSITADYIVSLEDGRRYKSMKRHLRGRGLTPDEYRRKWGLPHDYPMVAPNYAKARSELAKSMGLGQKRKKTTRRKRAA
jgi:predicted transcriptional regulator